MRAFTGLLIMLSAVSMGRAQSTTVRRTIATAPAQEDKPTAESGQPASPSEAQIRALIDNYRRSWEKMNDRTRKLMLSHGGQTPEQFEHSLRQRMFVPPPASANTAAAASPARSAEPNSSTQLNLDVLHTMSTSAEDLSTIRDGNVKRVQTGGCAAQITIRIADLRGKLAMYEHVLHPDAPVEVSAPEPKAKAVARPPSSASAAVASDWFNNRAEAPAPATNAAKRELDSVLGEDTPLKAAAPRSPDTTEQRREAESEIARIKPELERLNAACAAAH